MLLVSKEISLEFLAVYVLGPGLLRADEGALCKPAPGSLSFFFLFCLLLLFLLCFFFFGLVLRRFSFSSFSAPPGLEAAA